METLGHHTPLADRNYLASLVRSQRCQRVVEVGCYTGMTTRALVDASPDVIVHCIDHFEGNDSDELGEIAKGYGKDAIRAAFCRNLRDVLFGRVFLHEGTSELYAGLWPFPVDMVFIDAKHEYEDVKRDIELWTPHVKRGGILCGHDYGVFNGVGRAVDEITPDEVKGFVWLKWIL